MGIKSNVRRGGRAADGTGLENRTADFHKVSGPSRLREIGGWPVDAGIDGEGSKDYGRWWRGTLSPVPELREVKHDAPDLIRDWIVQQKEARGLSYQDLANAAGLGFHSVHRYLRYEPGQTQHRGLHAEAASKLLYALSAKIVLDE